MNWSLVRYHGLRHAVLTGGSVVVLAYAASRAAGVRYGLVALLLTGLGVLTAVFTLFGSGGGTRGVAVEPAAPMTPGGNDLETGSNNRAALAVFSASLGTSAWAFGSMVALGI